MSAARPDWKDWVRKAEEDFLCIRNNLAAKRVPWALVCFHAQQAGEKYLKAMLAFHGRPPLRIHDLATLLEECGDIQPEMEEVWEECMALTRHAVDARYPGTPPPEADAAEGKRMVAAALRVKRAVMGALRPKAPRSAKRGG